MVWWGGAPPAEGTGRALSKCHRVSFWIYLVLAAGVLVLLNLLFVILLAVMNRSGHESDLHNG